MLIRTKIALALGLATIFAGQANAEDPAWVSKVRQMIASKQTYPDSAQDRGEQGTAMIKISVDASGKLQSVELVKTSGSRTLDREAVTIPGKVGSFPAPGAAASVTLPLTWKLS